MEDAKVHAFFFIKRRKTHTHENSVRFLHEKLKVGRSLILSKELCRHIEEKLEIQYVGLLS